MNIILTRYRGIEKGITEMLRFWETVTYPLLLASESKAIVEIGAEHGGNSSYVLDYCRDHDAKLYVIDPLPKFDTEKFERDSGGHAKVLKAKSLDALREIPHFDFILIDGDHNWYTVYNELKEIERLSTERKAEFPLVMFHDVGWPYGRRDMYYNIADIPEEFRQPTGRGGLLPRQKEQTTEKRGLNFGVLNALTEGGARNGVRTAVEDFMKDHGNVFKFVFLPVMNGYGILYTDRMIADSGKLKEFITGITPSDKLFALMMTTEMARIKRTIAFKQLERGIMKFAGERLGWRIMKYLS
jgi:hypothetical protein